jgi:hypothetical protein
MRAVKKAGASLTGSQHLPLFWTVLRWRENFIGAISMNRPRGNFGFSMVWASGCGRSPVTEYQAFHSVAPSAARGILQRRFSGDPLESVLFSVGTARSAGIA